MAKVMLSLVTVLTLLSGCRSALFAPTTPVLPRGVEPLEWTAQRLVYWAEVEKCSGKKRDYQEVKLYVLPNTISFERPETGEGVHALYYPHHSIVWASLVVDLPDFERHEMLHAVRRDTGDRHDNEDFKTKCRFLIVP